MVKLDTSGAVSKRLLELCSKQNISVNRLARISAVPPSTVKNIISGGSKNPGVVTIKLLCDGLELSLNEFFASDLFKNLEQEIK